MLVVPNGALANTSNSGSSFVDVSVVVGVESVSLHDGAVGGAL